MWSKRLLGSVGVGQSPDSFALSLGFKAPASSSGVPQFSRYTQMAEDGELYTGVGVSWTDEDGLDSVIVRLAGVPHRTQPH